MRPDSEVSGNVSPESRSEIGSELLAALSGRDADRPHLRARRTPRARSVALAVTLVVLLLIAPLLWEVTDSLVAGEHLGDPRNQWSLWACIVCPMLLGAAIIAGWWRNRS